MVQNVLKLEPDQRVEKLAGDIKQFVLELAALSDEVALFKDIVVWTLSQVDFLQLAKYWLESC